MEKKRESGERTDNELIAGFMGHNKDAVGLYLIHEMSAGRHSALFRQDQIAYDTSWDWLMPVVEKIEEIALNVTIETGCVKIDVMDDAYPEYHNTVTFEWQEDTKLNVLYRAVVAFIKWYNNPQPPRV